MRSFNVIVQDQFVGTVVLEEVKLQTVLNAIDPFYDTDDGDSLGAASGADGYIEVSVNGTVQIVLQPA